MTDSRLFASKYSDPRLYGIKTRFDHAVKNEVEKRVENPSDSTPLIRALQTDEGLLLVEKMTGVSGSEMAAASGGAGLHVFADAVVGKALEKLDSSLLTRTLGGPSIGRRVDRMMKDYDSVKPHLGRAEVSNIIDLLAKLRKEQGFDAFNRDPERVKALVTHLLRSTQGGECNREPLRAAAKALAARDAESASRMLYDALVSPTISLGMRREVAQILNDVIGKRTESIPYLVGAMQMDATNYWLGRECTRALAEILGSEMPAFYVDDKTGNAYLDRKLWKEWLEKSGFARKV